MSQKSPEAAQAARRRADNRADAGRLLAALLVLALLALLDRGQPPATAAAVAAVTR